jgi:hypothetical protein
MRTKFAYKHLNNVKNICLRQIFEVLLIHHQAWLFSSIYSVSRCGNIVSQRNWGQNASWSDQIGDRLKVIGHALRLVFVPLTPRLFLEMSLLFAIPNDHARIQRSDEAFEVGESLFVNWVPKYHGTIEVTSEKAWLRPWPVSFHNSWVISSAVHDNAM